ncbi:adenylate/guanylate cyclase domain-containing protein [Mycolicibacterium sp. OfavD-34-C]|uniref:adenylate/guanylate cyclase domain-containing protein n=1 Tax=Mycolicibacterium sp. OfavD-34-C TaxID=2917746 RepID=UPI001EF4527F|nr:adenylate/guanylate cyclase domain-containing protein [Mycolicibacterium sp. OfavD-34-C]MCG7579189.1 adenylate/guanylate cyclase domain-containing protein [Mycolicibacterium sp. OfavD-34-C]
MRPRRLLVRYVAGLSWAYLLTLAEVVAIVMSLGGRSTWNAQGLVILAVQVIAGTTLVAVGATLTVRPTLRWLESGSPPTDKQVRNASRITRRQAAITLAPWMLATAILIPLNHTAGAAALMVIASTMLFGAVATVSTGFLFTLRTLRPILAGVSPGRYRRSVPGVRSRLLIMWLVCTALPGSAIALLLVMRSNSWLIDESTSIDLALLVLALVAVLLGLRAMILVSMSISDPVNQVIEAMAEVERGHIDRSVDVYEWSEIGRLQSGFNSMVAGLRERDRLRDLFGRHVGEEVARHAVAAEETSAGDERDVAVLFIDLVDSTQLAVDCEPHEVAEVLNAFFRIVVAQVDAHRGLINKFQGDAALAVFGAPLRVDDPAAAAMSTARALADELRSLPLDFGIGVSAGPVFAGNIGAENRYEYTVVGDAVNEAARLADHAKEFGTRTLCSGTARSAATPAERACWVPVGQTTLRGRSTATDLFAPRRPESPHPPHKTASTA